MVSTSCSCGGSHIASYCPDHEPFLATMPQEPTALVEDLIAMGVYQPNALSLARRWTQSELQAQLIQQASGGFPLREQMLGELIQEAGGIDQVMTAAFGVHAAEFFDQVITSGEFSRRRFLQRVVAAAAIVGMSSCTQASSPTQDAATPSPTLGDVEKKDLTIGFIPITCATPIVMSEPLGFYEKYGLNVTVRKLPNWAAVRDSAIAGELDAYHMLSPMPIAISIGLGSAAIPIKLASIENINGQAIAIATKHKGKVKDAKDFKGFKIGVPFPFSMHNLLIRYYLAAGGLNPDKDVQIFPVPPPDSVARMTAGEIDAMLMPEPFNQRAVFEKVGYIHMLSKELWNGHPCCAFAASQSWIEAHPKTFSAVNKAIIDACGFASDPANRPKIAEALIERKYLNQPLPVVQAVLTGTFEDGQGNTLNVPDRIGFDPYPWQSFAKWISSQMVRWDLLPKTKANFDQIADDVFLTEIAAGLQKELGQTPPTEKERVETLKYDTFDPKDPNKYVEEQIKKFKV